MESQLVKREDRWDLYEATGQKIASSLDGCAYKLSLKNCEAIELGYDLDELAKKYSENIYYKLEADEEFSGEPLGVLHGFKDGFQKALELMGDKKFSEDFLKRMCSVSFNFYKRNDLSDSELEEEWENWLKNSIQSLQQTEWDVEIEMERSQFIVDKSLRNDIKNGFNYTTKLDADGCLILKRIKANESK